MSQPLARALHHRSYQLELGQQNQHSTNIKKIYPAKSPSKLDGDFVLPIDKLEIGMYVSELDVPWVNTNFMLQGLLIESKKDIENISFYSNSVTVSPARSRDGLFASAVPVPQEKLPNIGLTQPQNSSVDKVANRTSTINTGTTRVERADGFKKDLNKSGFVAFVSQLFNLKISFPIPFSSTIQRRGNYKPSKGIKHGQPQPAQELIEIRNKVLASKAIRIQFKRDKDVPNDIVNHQATSALSVESPAAKLSQSDLSIAAERSLSHAYNASEFMGEIELTKKASQSIVASIIRNPEAMQLVSNIKKLSNASFQHAVDVSLMMVELGREMCLPEETLIEVGIGGLMHDVGEDKMPPESTHNKNLDKNLDFITKYKAYKDHISASDRIMENTSYSNIVKQIVSNHHEHYDGTGYPRGISGSQIGIYGLMANIVDSYVSLTTGRSCDKKLTPSKAIGLMYKEKGKAFHPQILDQFIQAIGTYPVGSIVKLSTGHTAIVIKQNKSKKLKPIIMLVRDKNDNEIKEKTYINMAELKPKDDELKIVKELHADKSGIDVGALLSSIST